MNNERRRCRSEHSSVALRLLLSARCANGTFDSIVISDEEGFAIASSAEGKFDAEGVAAVLPLKDRRGDVDGLRVQPFNFLGTTLFVGAVGGHGFGDAEEFRETIRGVQRILSERAAA